MNWSVHVALVAVQLLFSSLPIAAKFVLPSLGPAGIVFFRVSGSAIAFATVYRLRGAERVTDRRDLWAMAGLALIGVVLNQLFFLEGVKRTTAIDTNILITAMPAFTLAIALILGRERASVAKSSLVAMYVYLQPLITAVAAPILLGERVTARAGVAAALIFSGLALATWGEQVAGRQLGAAFRPPSEGV